MAHITVLPPKERTASSNSPDIKNHWGEGAIFFVDVSAGAGTELTFTIQGKNPTKGTYYNILSGVTVSGVVTQTFRVHPELTAANNTVAKDMMPTIFRVSVAHGNSNPVNYSVGASIV